MTFLFIAFLPVSFVKKKPYGHICLIDDFIQIELRRFMLNCQLTLFPTACQKFSRVKRRATIYQNEMAQHASASL